MADVVSFDVDSLARGQTPRESSLGYSLTRSDEREKAATAGGRACRVLFRWRKTSTLTLTDGRSWSAEIIIDAR